MRETWAAIVVVDAGRPLRATFRRRPRFAQSHVRGQTAP
jgi:hypothetical protein